MSKINKQFNIAILSTVFLLGFVFVAQASEITEQKVIDLVNDSRKKAGLSELLSNQKLDQVANLKAQDMLDNKYFAHTSPQGKTPWDWFAKGGYSYKYAGENLAIDFVSVEAQHEAWMKSETHRKNILSEKFSEIGVAVAVGEIEEKKNSILVVQIFGKPSFHQANKKENILMEKDREFDFSNKKTGTILSSQDLANFQNKNLGKKEDDFGFLSDILWVFVLVFAMSALIVSPIRMIEKGYLEIAKIAKLEIRKKRLIFKDNLQRCEDLMKKIEVKNYDGSNLDKIKTVKIRT